MFKMITSMEYSERYAILPAPIGIHDFSSLRDSGTELISPLLKDFAMRQNQAIFEQWENLHQSNYGFTVPHGLAADPYSLDNANEPRLIRKRNERERLRVRSVNEGYERLRKHLPIDSTEKRLSKVETLREAMRYIKLLQAVLRDTNSNEDSKSQPNSKIGDLRN